MVLWEVVVGAVFLFLYNVTLLSMGFDSGYKRGRADATKEMTEFPRATRSE